MKQCPNPDCLSHQQGRVFYDDDTICPRCGEVLVNPALAGAAPATSPYAAYAGAAPAAAAPAPVLSNTVALIAAVATLLLVFLIIAFLLGLGRNLPIFRGASPAGSPGSANPQTLAAQATGTAVALATIAVQSTPVGGLVFATPVVALTVQSTGPLPPLPALPTALGGSGPGNGSAGGGAPGGAPGANPTPAGTPSTSNGGPVRMQLCRVIDAGQTCDAVTALAPTDTLYVAVQATFDTVHAQTIHVRLFGPPNGEQALFTQDQSVTPTRQGTFWVGFAFTPSAPWTPGVYRADVFVNNDTQRTTFTTWTVHP